MLAAIHNNEIVTASYDAPKEATCPYCGEMVRLQTQMGIGYYHLRPTSGRMCRLTRQNYIPEPVLLPVKPDERQIKML